MNQIGFVPDKDGAIVGVRHGQTLAPVSDPVILRSAPARLRARSSQLAVVHPWKLQPVLSRAEWCVWTGRVPEPPRWRLQVSFALFTGEVVYSKQHQQNSMAYTHTVYKLKVN